MNKGWLKYGLLIVLIGGCFICRGYEIPQYGGDTIIVSRGDSVTLGLNYSCIGVYDGWVEVRAEDLGVLLVSGECLLGSIGGGNIKIYDGNNHNRDFVASYRDTVGISIARCFSGSVYVHFKARFVNITDSVKITIKALPFSEYIHGVDHQVIGDGNRVLLTWQDLSNETEWRIRCRPLCAESRLVDIEVSEPSIELSKILSNKEYKCCILGVNDYESSGVVYDFTIPCKNVTIDDDFSNLYSCNVVCTSGSFFNPFQDSVIMDFEGESQNRHQVCRDTTEMDYETGYNMRKIPLGDSVSVRLGNNQSGAKAESVTYKYQVDTSMYNVLLLKYAAVLQNPDHDNRSQPRFDLKVLDSNNVEVDHWCYSASYVSNRYLGWNVHGLNLWKDWTTIGVNLERFHGQTIYIQLVTYDCKIGGHFGYAYYNLRSDNKIIKSVNCGDMVENTFTAPDGFSYEWYKEDDPNVILSDEQTLHVTESGVYKCKMSMIGSIGRNCGVVMSAEAGYRYPYARFSTTVVGDECENKIQFKDESTIVKDEAHTMVLNEPCESVWWDFGDGQTSLERNPVHEYTWNGVYTVTMVANVSGGQCSDTLRRNIRVGMNCPNRVIYDTTCEDTYQFLILSLLHRVYIGIG